MEANVSSAVRSAAFYDQFWDQYGEGPPDSCERVRLDYVLRSLARVAGRPRRILDFGCGRGWMAPFLAQFGDVTAVDFSSKGIEFASLHYVPTRGSCWRNRRLATSDSPPTDSM
jgi:2-polyprenyl-3-methyl-5-hydroxy-6-metoxy-1,4-benzoquinol methylase